MKHEAYYSMVITGRLKIREKPPCRTANAAVCAEIEISKRQEDTIHKIFLDPTGNHLLACLHGGETYYLHSSAARPKRLLKWSGVVVEAIAFDAQRCTEVRGTPPCNTQDS